jgi:RND family efflux transporter MFP subunit
VKQRRRFNSPANLTIIALVLFVVLTVVLAGCTQIPGLGGGTTQRPAGAAGGRAVTVSVQPAKEGPISMILPYAGSVQAIDQVNVVSKVSGRIEKALVDVGATVKAGDVLATLDRTSLDPGVKQAEANLAVAQAKLSTIQAGSRPEDIAQAEATLSSAKAKLAQVTKGATAADLQAADSAVVAAQSTLAKAQSDLQKLKQSPTADDLKAASLDLEKAKNALYSAQTSRDGVCGNGKNPAYQCQSSEATVNASEVALAQAQRIYDNVKAGPKPEDVATAQQAVTGAQAQLTTAQAKQAQLKAGPTAEDLAIAQATVTQAESQLSLKKTPYTPNDVQTAQAQIAQAQAALDAAKAQLNEATIVAPFDGVVTQKLLDAGSLASTQAPVFVLSTSAVEVAVSVEESRFGLVLPGQPVALAIPALVGQPIPAKVSSVAPSADPKTHTFVVKVTPNDQDGKLKAGMFADVKITAKDVSKAVLVTKESVLNQNGKTIVFVVADGKAALRQVSTGLSDDVQVEIVSGVKAGEQVVTAGQSSLSDGDAVRLTGQATGGQQPSGTPGAAPGKPGGAGQGAPNGQAKPDAKPSGKPDAAATGTPAADGAAATPTPKQ